MGKFRIVDFLAKIFSAISIVIAICGLYYSFQANKNSNHANDISKEALRISQEHFVATNRPEITVTAIRQKEIGKFFSVTRSNNEVIVGMLFEMENIGNVTASNILPPENFVVRSKNPEFLVPLKDLPTLDLQPGKKHTIHTGFAVICDSEEEVQEKVAFYSDSDFAGIEMEIPVEYSNALDATLKYRTVVKQKLLSDRAIWLKSKSEVISDQQ